MAGANKSAKAWPEPDPPAKYEVGGVRFICAHGARLVCGGLLYPEPACSETVKILSSA